MVTGAPPPHSLGGKEVYNHMWMLVGMQQRPPYRSIDQTSLFPLFFLLPLQDGEQRDDLAVGQLSQGPCSGCGKVTKHPALLLCSCCQYRHHRLSVSSDTLMCALATAPSTTRPTARPWWRSTSPSAGRTSTLYRREPSERKHTHTHPDTQHSSSSYKIGEFIMGFRIEREI